MAGKKGQKKRFWADEEKRLICEQASASGVSVAHVARRYSMNANLIFKWLRDPRFAPALESATPAEPCFLPVEIVGRVHREDAGSAGDARPAGGTIEIDISGGHRLRISGAYDPEALARLIRGLSA